MITLTAKHVAQLYTFPNWISAWLIRGGFEPAWDSCPQARKYYLRAGQKLWEHPQGVSHAR